MNKLMFLFLAIFLLSFISAEVQTLGVFKQDDCVNLMQICGNCTYNNISSVLYPNSSQAVGQVTMTKTGTQYDYSFCKTSVIGQYIVNGFGDLNGVNTPWNYDFDITGNGNDAPSGSVIVLFTIVFIGILIFMMVLLVTSLGHAIKLDFDMKDLALNIGIYCGLIAFFYLENFYLGNPMLHDIIGTIIYVGAVTSVFLPVLYFILTLTVGTYMAKRVKGVDY